MEDNLYDSLSARYTKALARAMAYTKQTKRPLNTGFDTFTSGDGAFLFSDSHGTVAGGNNRSNHQWQQTLTKHL